MSPAAAAGVPGYAKSAVMSPARHGSCVPLKAELAAPAPAAAAGVQATLTPVQQHRTVQMRSAAQTRVRSWEAPPVSVRSGSHGPPNGAGTSTPGGGVRMRVPSRSPPPQQSRHSGGYVVAQAQAQAQHQQAKRSPQAEQRLSGAARREVHVEVVTTSDATRRPARASAGARPTATRGSAVLAAQACGGGFANAASGGRHAQSLQAPPGASMSLTPSHGHAAAHTHSGKLPGAGPAAAKVHHMHMHGNGVSVPAVLVPGPGMAHSGGHQAAATPQHHQQHQHSQQQLHQHQQQSPATHQVHVEAARYGNEPHQPRRSRDSEPTTLNVGEEDLLPKLSACEIENGQLHQKILKLEDELRGARSAVSLAEASAERLRTEAERERQRSRDAEEKVQVLRQELDALHAEKAMPPPATVAPAMTTPAVQQALEEENARLRRELETKQVYVSQKSSDKDIYMEKFNTLTRKHEKEKAAWNAKVENMSKEKDKEITLLRNRVHDLELQLDENDGTHFTFDQMMAAATQACQANAERDHSFLTTKRELREAEAKVEMLMMEERTRHLQDYRLDKVMGSPGMAGTGGA